MFDSQKQAWAEVELLGYKSVIEFEEFGCDLHYNNELFKFNKRGEVVAGSAVAKSFYSFYSSDIDIYFKSLHDIKAFYYSNTRLLLTSDNLEALERKKNITVEMKNHNVNLILSDHNTPQDVISQFDIRACSVAWCPDNNKVYAIKGAVEDVIQQRIVFNPFPKHTSVTRLIKYIKKGFSIDRYQTAIFTELIKNEKIHNINLELTTGGYGGEVIDEDLF